MLTLGFKPAIAAAQTTAELEVELLEVHLGWGSETRTAFDDFELQALYSRSLADKVAVGFGMRHDMRAGSNLMRLSKGNVRL